MGGARNTLKPEKFAKHMVVVRRKSATAEELRCALDGMEREFLAAIPYYAKSDAAGLLEVSHTTLDKWISMGLIPTVKVPGYTRERIPSEPLHVLAAKVGDLREIGQKRRGLLAEALLKLEQEDPAWKKKFDELYGPALAARERGDELVSAAPGPDWDPEDSCDPNDLEFVDEDE